MKTLWEPQFTVPVICSHHSFSCLDSAKLDIRSTLGWGATADNFTEIVSWPRDIYASSILDATKNVLGSIVEKTIMAETGHIVIRVYPGGSNYTVFVLDDNTDEYNIMFQNDYVSR